MALSLRGVPFESAKAQIECSKSLNKFSFTIELFVA